MNPNDFDKNEALQDNPSHYFNEAHFSTLVLNSDDFAKKNKEQIQNLVRLFTDGGNEEKDEALKILKKEDGREMLLFAIANSDFKSHRQLLVAACWESGLDFSKYLEFFIQLIIGSDYGLCMEACTVIECMEGPFQKNTKELCLTKLTELYESDKEKQQLLEPVVEHLKNLP